MRKPPRCSPVVGVLMASALAGCSSLGGWTGAIAGVATGTFSSNPAVGLAVGVTVKAATDAEMRRLFRGMQSEEQDRIAETAGALQVGDRRPWQVHHPFHYADHDGEVQVLATIDNALAVCKEVLFSVVSGDGDSLTPEWFVTQTCRQSDGRWRWAAAEPAVGRWGALQ